MKNYRVWEANRKVFLYPEKWIEPELRDDKTPFFKELDNDLLAERQVRYARASAGHFPLVSPAVSASAAFTVFVRSIATVIGPTPPGTGVIAAAFSATASKSTSPTRR
jgi:hypothetical protein